MGNVNVVRLLINIHRDYSIHILIEITIKIQTTNQNYVTRRQEKTNVTVKCYKNAIFMKGIYLRVLIFFVSNDRFRRYKNSQHREIGKVKRLTNNAGWIIIFLLFCVKIKHQSKFESSRFIFIYI